MTDPTAPFLIRRCAWPAGTLHRLEPSELGLAETRLRGLEGQLGAALTDVSEALHRAIETTRDAPERALLLDLRRDLHNRRARASRSFERAAPVMDVRLRNEVGDAVAKLHESRTELEAFGQTYDTAVTGQRAHLRDLVDDDTFLRGLALSSHSLLEETRSFIARPWPRTFRKRDTRVERGVLAYLTRAAVKTSPRGPWTIQGTPHHGSSETTTVRSIVFNTSMVALWLEALMQRDQAAVCWPLRMNPSLLRDGAQYVWLLASGGRESTRRCAITPSLERILSLFDHESETTPEAVFRRLELDDAQWEGFRRQVGTLVAEGLLESCIPIDLQDHEAHQQLLEVLDQAGTDEEAGHALREINAGLQSIRTAPSIAWPSLQRRIHAASLRVSALLGASATPVCRAEEIVFQHDVETMVPEPPGLRRVESDLRRFGTCLGPGIEPVWPREELDRVWDRFGSKSEVPLLLAYEAIAHARERLEYRVAAPGRLAPDLLPIDDTNTLHLSPEALAELRDRVLGRANRSASSRSWAAAVQMCSSDSFVVNVLVPGYDIRFSRPCVGYPPRPARSSGRSSSPSNPTIWAQLRDRSSLNVNHGQPRLDVEILLPGLRRRVPASQSLRLADLHIARTADGYRLLHAPTRQNVAPVFFGFQSRCRSGLTRFVQALSPSTREHPWMEIRRRINEAALPASRREDAPGVFPRIVFDRSVVLQRRTWIIPAAHLPCLRGPDAKKYLPLRDWQRNLGLPDRCFVRIVDRFGQREPDARADDCKPQYISFRSPQLAVLFERIVARVPSVLWVYEMLPELPDNDEERVEEFIVQWEEPS